jgi:hypothetical protein
MSVAARKRIHPKGYHIFSEEQRRDMSLQRKGKNTSLPKIDRNVVRELYELYESKPLLDGVGKVRQNGKVLTYDRAFANAFSDRFGITNTMLHNLVKGKTIVWKELYDEIVMA